MGDLLTSPSLTRLEDEFVQLVATARRNDPFAPVNVLVGSNLQHIYMRRLLAARLGVVANVRFLTLIDLAGELYLSSPGNELHPLPDGGGALLVREAANRSSVGRVLPLEVRGMAEAVTATMRDLREGAVDEGSLTALPSSSRIRAVAALYSSYGSAMTGFIDRTRLLEEACLRDEQDFSQVLPEGPVLVYGIYDLTELQLRMLARLNRVKSVTALVSWDPDSSAFEFASDTVARLRYEGFTLRNLGHGPARAETQVFSAADRQAQAEEVVRRVLQDVEAGVPPAAIAILHRLDQRYDEVLEVALARASLPTYLAAGRPVRRTSVGRAALGLMDLLLALPRRSALLEFLSLPCVSLQAIQPGLTPTPSSWERISKESGLVEGWDEFHSALSLRLQGQDEEERTQRGREQAEALLSVIGALRERSDRLASATSWAEASEYLVSQFEDLVQRQARPDAYDAIADRLRQLRLIDQLGVEFTVERLQESAARAIRETTTSGGFFQRDGIFVGNVMAARGLRFRHVYIAECGERIFPPVIRQDPFLPDSERVMLNEARNGWLPRKAGRLAEERLLFELACQSAEDRLTLSYSRRTNPTGGPRLPSSFFLQEGERLSHRFESIGAIEGAGHSWFTRLASRVGFSGREPLDALRALDQSDLRVHVLENGTFRANTKIRSIWPDFDRLLALQSSRREHVFGSYDGIVPGSLIRDSNVLGGDISPTSLADFATCPYRFFLSKVLGLRAVEEPEETTELAPIVRGELVHRVLERYVTLYLERGGSWAEFLAQGGPVLQGLMDEEFSQLPTGKAGLPVVQTIIRETVEGEVRQYLEGERAAADQGWTPTAVELWFDGLGMPLEDSLISSRGRIDRLDTRGEEFRVVDYKTGLAREEADGYRKGGSLQLPIYMTAAAHLQDRPLNLGAAEYHYVSKRAAFKKIALTGAELERDSRFGEMLNAVREGVTGGEFFYRPGRDKSNCRFCSFSEVCHSQVDTHFETKAPGSRSLMSAWRQVVSG